MMPPKKVATQGKRNAPMSTLSLSKKIWLLWSTVPSEIMPMHELPAMTGKACKSA